MTIHWNNGQNSIKKKRTLIAHIIKWKRTLCKQLFRLFLFTFTLLRSDHSIFPWNISTAKATVNMYTENVADDDMNMRIMCIWSRIIWQKFLMLYDCFNMHTRVFESERKMTQRPNHTKGYLLSILTHWIDESYNVYSYRWLLFITQSPYCILIIGMRWTKASHLLLALCSYMRICFTIVLLMRIIYRLLFDM